MARAKGSGRHKILYGISGLLQAVCGRIFESGLPYHFCRKKGKKTFKWTAECQRSFEQLNPLLTTTSILSIIDLGKDYVVCTDASKEGVGGVLM